MGIKRDEDSDSYQQFSRNSLYPTDDENPLLYRSKKVKKVSKIWKHLLCLGLTVVPSTAVPICLYTAGNIVWQKVQIHFLRSMEFVKNMI